MKHFTLIFSLIILTSCFKNPADNSIDASIPKPKELDVSGEYKLSSQALEDLKISDSVYQHAVCKLNPNMTFELRCFPHHSFGDGFEKFDIVNAKGNWHLEKDQGIWVIPMDFDTIVNTKTNKNMKAHYAANHYHLNGDPPKYKIYLSVGDPDSWAGIALEKK